MRMQEKIKRWTSKKLISCVMSGVVLVTSFAVSHNVNVVYAEDIIFKPTKNTYLSNTDFKASSFNNTYNLSGGTQQPVYFGKNGSSKQSWYIAGYEDNGLVLFCDPSKPLAKRKYNSDPNMCISSSNAYVTFTDGETYNMLACDYGCSDLRKYLISLTNGNYNNKFTVAEQNLMDYTDIYTDLGGAVYRTSEKLYAANGEIMENYVTVGKNSSTNIGSGKRVYLTLGSYSEGDSFWVRGTSGLLVEEEALFTDGDHMVWSTDTDASMNVVPAFHLNFSSILFASTLKEVSATASFENAMNFRYDSSKSYDGSVCTDRIISSAIANKEAIKVTNPTQGEYLYLQWNDGTTDKVKSYALSSDKTVYTSEDGLPSVLTNCKMWIEKKDSTDNLIYAKEVSYNENNHILHSFINNGNEESHACSVCDVTEKHNKLIVVSQKVNPTCITTGKEAVYKCSVCGYETGGELINKVSHVWDNGNVSKKATCIAKGEMTYKCTISGCNAIKYEEIQIDNNNHAGEKIVKNGKPATCLESGKTGDIFCADCGVQIGTDQVISPLGHSWDDGTVLVAATCSERGSSRFVCTAEGCNAVKIEDTPIDKTNHVGETEIKNKKDATCEEEGYSGDTYCSSCNEIINHGTTIDVKGHMWNEGTVTKQATCVEEGSKVYVCTVDGCDGTKTETIDSDKYNHVGTQTIKNAIKATCTKEGYTGDRYCDSCESLIEKGKDLEKTEHEWNKGNVTSMATCIKTGVITYECTSNECDATKTQKTDIDLTNHVGNYIIRNKKNATCYEEGYSGDTCCDACSEIITYGRVIDKSEHKVIIKNKKNSTYKTNGYTGDKYCSVCNKKIQSGKAIAKLKPLAQKITIKKVKLTHKASSLKRKSAIIRIGAKAKGGIAYKVTRGKAKYIRVTSKGTVLLKKGCRKGTYKVTINAKATKSGKYKAAKRVITIKVK